MGTPELRTCPVKLTCEVGNSGPPGVGVRGGFMLLLLFSH